MIEIIDNTSFSVDILSLYKTDLSDYIIDNIIENVKNNGFMDFTKNYIFDLLLLTPTNLVSDWYKMNFTIDTMFIDGLKMQDMKDILKQNQTDITNIEEQFADELFILDPGF